MKFMIQPLQLLLILSFSLMNILTVQAASGRVQPTHKDVRYGSDDNDVMNVWMVESELPTPVIVQIHGGGFHAGKNKQFLPEPLMQRLKEERISYISIDYRLIKNRRKHTDIRELTLDLHETLKHIARAIQFIRSKSDEWNIDPDLLCSTGGSAGAAATMWLAYHDNMADPDNKDPVLRESTRMTCAYGRNVAVISLDPLNPDKIKLNETTRDKRIINAQLKLLGLSSIDEARAQLDTPEMQAIRKELGIIEYMSHDDPPVAMSNIRSLETYNGRNVHNPHTIPVFKRYCEANKLECNPIMYNTPKHQVVKQDDFLIQKLTEARAKKRRDINLSKD